MTNLSKKRDKKLKKNQRVMLGPCCIFQGPTSEPTYRAENRLEIDTFGSLLGGQMDNTGSLVGGDSLEEFGKDEYPDDFPHGKNLTEKGALAENEELLMDCAMNESWESFEQARQIQMEKEQLYDANREERKAAQVRLMQRHRQRVEDIGSEHLAYLKTIEDCWRAIFVDAMLEPITPGLRTETAKYYKGELYVFTRFQQLITYIFFQVGRCKGLPSKSEGCPCLAAKWRQALVGGC